MMQTAHTTISSGKVPMKDDIVNKTDLKLLKFVYVYIISSSSIYHSFESDNSGVYIILCAKVEGFEFQG